MSLKMYSKRPLLKLSNTAIKAFKYKSSPGKAFLRVIFLFCVNCIYDYVAVLQFSDVCLSRTRALEFLCSESTRGPSPGFPYFMIDTVVL